MFERLSNADVRILYLIMVIAVSFPLIRPIGLPIPIAEQTRASYRAIEENVHEGDIVLIGIDFAPNQEAEMWPQVEAVGTHIASRGARMILLNMIVGGARYEQRFEELMLNNLGLEYGVDILSLPFSAGREAAFQSLVTDLKGLYKVDLHGNPLDELQLWNEVTDISDCKMYVEFADAPDWWLRPMRQAAGLLLWNGTVASGASTMAPLYQSGQLCGFIIGASGGAEYELLIGKPGLAVAAMDGQSIGHALIMLFVVLGNIGYYTATRRKSPRPAQ